MSSSPRRFLSDVRSRADIVGVVMDVSCMTNCCNTPAKHHQRPRRAVNARPDLCRSLRDSQIQPSLLPCASLAPHGAFPETASRNPQNVLYPFRTSSTQLEQIYEAAT